MVSSPPADAARRSILQRCWFDIPLWQRILPALVLGVAVGLLWGEGAVQLKWIGDVFVRLTRMLIVPLVFLTIAAGVLGLGDPKRLGSLGARSIGLFVCTAATAAAVGLLLGLLLQPGVGVSVTGATPQAIKASKTIAEQLMGIIPINPVQAMVEGEMLAIIFFAIVFAAGVLALGERARPVADLLSAASEVMLTLIRFVIEAAPFGVFGLIAAAVGANGPGVFVNVSLLALGTLLGCLIQTLVVQAAVVRLAANLPAFAFLRGVVDAMLVAFSTSSSSASLPVEMSVAEKNLGIRKPILSTVLPVGVSIGRDGTAMYVALLSMFAIQALGISVTGFDLVLVVVISTLLAVSAPPAPSAALFMMAAVLSVVGISDAQSALIIGFILPFDRLLDMMRTVPNVVGNLANATVIARWAGEIDVERFRSAPVE
ncbi:MAG: dicarboxylate/amino acid:cation symporter [Phenylobacterium sp.]|uniref:dicarboxylate/amino acid:cation symporter n=1 Tax=Phenylobacterium sp. TaxID=1871053 RepID=UPI0012230603|nr:dicarboxylate/amino acid:cation symporter [Phenylobacterium sp.]TAJ72755.1 MAG: dicarboxylate/amino acid:cation symporter [Phenylobacterium sp.]